MGLGIGCGLGCEGQAREIALLCREIALGSLRERVSVTSSVR